MTKPAYNHLFGPVLSRRLGRSLGVDVMPFKTCTFDCIYCEQGRTTHLTTRRREYFPSDEILNELKDYLDTNPPPDYITLSGGGEPTLNARLGEIVKNAKAFGKCPVAVITNSSLLWDPSVQKDLSLADVVLPSLDAGNARIFQLVDRPAPGITFERMVEGLMSFRDVFSGAIWLEVMLVDGLTSGEAEVREIARLVREIRPDRIQLNTVVRPPAESFAQAIPKFRLEQLAGYFTPRAEVIADYRADATAAPVGEDDQRLVDLLERRPCSTAQIADTLGLRAVVVCKLLERLRAQGRIYERVHGGDVYFSSIPPDAEGFHNE